MNSAQKVKVVADAGKRGIELRGANREILSAKEHIVLVSGPADCGKSVGACVKSHLISLRCPGAQGAIIRKTKASLKETILNTFDRIIKNQGVVKMGGNNPHSYVYPNGSKIWLGGMDKPDKVLSAERDFIQICQAEELSQNDIEIMATRCSGRASVIAVPQIFGDCNPGPRNHWIKQMEKAGTLKLLAATHKDNPTLFHADGTMIDSDDVRRRMKVLDDLTGVRRLRLRDGIWATAEGAVYEMFNALQTGQKSDHVQVRDRAEMQRFYFAGDDGFTNPAVILDIGSDSDGRWHIFREFYKCGIVQDDVAEFGKQWNLEIHKINGRGIDLLAGDEAAPGLIEAFRRKGINAIGGKGGIFDGIAKIQAKLKVQSDGRPRLTMDPCCVNTINEFESYVWRPGKDLPVDANNHCFAPGTKILTKTGLKPIEEIKKGEYVWSPLGWSKVWESGPSGIKKVKDYGAFRCTPDHKILTDRGLIQVDALRYLDKVFVWQKTRKWFLREFLTGVTRNHAERMTDFISEALAVKTQQAARHTCTALYGNTIKGKFLLAWKCITKTAILGTIKLAISFWSLMQIMGNCTNGEAEKKQKTILPRSGHLQQSDARKSQILIGGIKDSANKLKNHGKKDPNIKEFATHAEKNIQLPSLVEAGSVISIAKCEHSVREETQSSKNISHTEKEIRIQTYNLNTEHGCYFANGILVCNSLGALRYLSDALNEPSGAFSSIEGIRAGGKSEENLFQADNLSLADLSLDVDLGQ